MRQGDRPSVFWRAVLRGIAHPVCAAMPDADDLNVIADDLIDDDMLLSATDAHRRHVLGSLAREVGVCRQSVEGAEEFAGIGFSLLCRPCFRRVVPNRLKVALSRRAQRVTFSRHAALRAWRASGRGKRPDQRAQRRRSRDPHQ